MLKYLGKYKSIVYTSQDPVEALKSIGTSLYNAGKSVLTSFWNGLKDIWSGVSSWWEEKVNWVKDKFSWITGKASEAQSAAKSIPAPQAQAAALLSVPQIQGVETRARAYQANTFAGKMVQSKQQDNREMNDVKNLLGELINIVSSGKVVKIDNTVVLDGRAIAKGTAKYMSSEIDTINKRKMRYGGNL